MKHAFPLMFLAFAIIGSISAQNYRPFVPDWIYVYESKFISSWTPTIESEGLFSLMVDSVSVNGADTIFHFNRIRNMWGFNLWRDSADNAFGGSIIRKPGDHYLFTTWDFFWETRDTFHIYTDLPQDSMWTFHDSSGIQAHISSRSIRTVASTTDSVITISLSSGDSILISKNYGLIQGFPLVNIYVTGL